jgi:aminoglycoside phosphotransferase (APT) family kinase protein
MSETPGTADDTRAVRAGDAIDGEALASWMAQHAPGVLGDGHGPLEIRQFAGGYSNLTYLVRRGPHEVVLRRPPPGITAGPAHDVLREACLLQALWPITAQVPELLAQCDDARVLGAPFYLMRRVSGVILRDRAPDGLVLDAPAMDRLCAAFVDALVALHAVDVRTTGLDRFGRGDGYVARQVAGWTQRWRAAETVPQPAMEQLAAWLAAQQPAGGAPSVLIHNDFKFDNLVLDPHDLSRVRAVLDWEMATIGDPLMDLGTTLAYWIEPDDPPLFRALGLGITTRPGAWTRAALVRGYGERSGRDVSAIAFYAAFGRFKLAVVAQQLHARFARGLSRDERFAALGEVVRALAEQGVAGAG